MIADRRRHPRKQHRVPLRFGPDAPDRLGLTQNVSLGGLEISSAEVFDPNTTLRLSLETDNVDIALTGTVQWVGPGDPAGAYRNSYYTRHYRRAMGIQVLNAPEVYEKFVHTVIEPSDWLRRQERYGKVFQVVVRSADELLHLYTQDISRGGIFVLADVFPVLQTLVALEIVIPETARVVHAEGRVVHHLQPESAVRAGRNPGFGVQFTQFFGADQEILDGYIAELQRHIASST